MVVTKPKERFLEYTVHRKESAPEASKPIIDKVKGTYGMLPNLMATLAESPAAIEGYSTLMSIFEKSDLSATEKQVIMMTNNRLNGCHYCMAAHTAASKHQGVPDDIVRALRDGSQLNDSKLEALRTFTEKVFHERGNASQEDVNEFLNAGYTKGNILEVILGVGLKVLSNYSTKFTQPPIDAPFKKFEWSTDEK